MARSFDVSTLAAVNAGRFGDRGMILFDFASGFYGFWTGLGPLEYNAVTYIGAGSLISVQSMSEGISGAAIPVTVRLTGIPNSDLSPDVLASIESETYHQRPVVISTAYFSDDDGALLSVEPEYRGYIDRLSHEHSIGGSYILTAHLESKARDHFKTGYRKRGDADQRVISADDGFLRHAAVAGTQEIFWGRTAPASQN